ncbi:MAG TPA: hypothetical protein VFV80_09145 [Geminicoccaceae bacterium]|nr:hypothetical protein [Geminicoccaceae bacterium]
MVVTLFALGLSAAAALVHRFAAADSMAFHISLLRMELRDKPKEDRELEKALRDRRLKQSGWLLLLSSGLLGLGALALAVSFMFLLKPLPADGPPHPTSGVYGWGDLRHHGTPLVPGQLA